MMPPGEPLHPRRGGGRALKGRYGMKQVGKRLRLVGAGGAGRTGGDACVALVAPVALNPPLLSPRQKICSTVIKPSLEVNGETQALLSVRKR